jgi:chitinase
MDPIIFIYNILDVLDEWGFDGIDIQCNSEIIGSNEENKYEIALESLITNLRKYIKNDKLITFTTFSSAKYNKYIIKNTSKYIDWVNFIIDDNNNNIQPLIDNILDNRYSLNVNNDKNIATYVWGIKNVI